jgi:hypothetical protein
LPTVYALRGKKGKEKKKKRKGKKRRNHCPNNTRKCQKIPTHDKRAIQAN